MTHLPQGWEVKTIEDVCKNSNSNLALKDIKDKSGDYPVFGASGIVGYVDFFHKAQECLGIIKDGAGVGRVFVLPKQSSVIGTLSYLENNETTNLKYLFYFLKNLDFSKYILGSAIPHIYFRDYKKEQMRIVKILDSAFEKIDKSVELLKANLANLDELAQSVLDRAFNPLGDSIDSTESTQNPSTHDTQSPYPLPQYWEWKTLGEIANTSSGSTPLRNRKEYWENGTIHWLKSGELNDSYINLVEEKITEEALKHSPVKLLDKGTLLIAMYGATAGKLGILNVQTTTNQAICAFLHKDSNNLKFFEKFLFYFLLSIRSKIISDSFGGAQPNISQAYIKSLQIPLPKDIKEQEQIAKHLDSTFERIKKLKELYNAQLQDYEELKQSLLTQAFSGKL
ncbi:restriction endonuclease subunit S [uncultured Helicobacter sp.]|uniref:restriction endonuclease subunit S n=1 Tax=uncultured Helicobacter sp. TaxID=175537 RepID=UPI00374EDBCD